MASFAIVPAAGRSVRMGRPKLLMPWGDGTIIEATISAWRSGGVSRIIVVVHPDDAELADVCRQCADSRGVARACRPCSEQSTGDTPVPPRVDVVVAEFPPLDMKASVRRGLQFIRDQLSPVDADVWLVAPADLPTLSCDVIRRLLAERVQEESLVPVHSGKRGHPVLFPWSAAAAVDQLGADEGLDALMRSLPLREIDCSDIPAAADIDTPDDYRRQHNRHN